ncbi:HlyD family secretion protein [Flavobacterium sp. SM15]|uniref:HlyD family secretion protein n=1 Tax=Flavobacterium sp. SM15 TaxID=2908005 RepID=UPI001EDC43AD|nr:HlyD family efflux transporter periplasmic adaptor subunit [Flavobacterium sp. SM15]MCG2610565.1 HlyD family secretion protein [Flavobacterium sp. SM15]
MNEIQDNLKIYSEEVQDVLSHPPRSIFRWGNTILLFFILLLLLISWYIKYPDVVRTTVTITTNIPPEKLITKTAGRIESILIADRKKIKKNTPIAIIENSANYNDVFILKKITDTINLEKTNFPFDKFQFSSLGDVENAYILFHKEYTSSELNQKLQPFKAEQFAEKNEAQQIHQRINLLTSQKKISESELILQKNDLNRYEKLFKKGVVSEQEFEKQKLLFFQAQKNHKVLLSSISQMKSSLNEAQKSIKNLQINEHKESVTLERNVIQAFYQLKKAIKDWELNYVLRASISGTVSYLQIWKENQTVTVGENVFAIIPESESGFIAKVKAPALNSGKIKTGQTANIRLVNYPDREFGILKGMVQNIALTPDKEGNLLIDIALPKGLETSYNKKINFQQEMQGTADVITEDLRLIERLLYQFRDLIK